MHDPIIRIGLILIITIASFLLCREIVCWYFKINSIEKLLSEIRDALKKE